MGVPDANDNPVKAAACYDVYGNRNQLGGTTATRHHFCGSLGHSDFTADTGLIYMRARWYDPAIGRFISEAFTSDSIGNTDEKKNKDSDCRNRGNNAYNHCWSLVLYDT